MLQFPHSCLTKSPPGLSEQAAQSQGWSRRHTPCRCSQGGIILIPNWTAERRQQERLEPLGCICVCLLMHLVCVFMTIIISFLFPGQLTPVWRPVVPPEGGKPRVNAGESHLRSGVFQCACSEDDRTTDGLLMSFKVTCMRSAQHNTLLQTGSRKPESGGPISLSLSVHHFITPGGSSNPPPPFGQRWLLFSCRCDQQVKNNRTQSRPDVIPACEERRQRDGALWVGALTVGVTGPSVYV